MLRKIWHFVRWPLAFLVVAYAVLVAFRIPAVGEKQRTADTIAAIQSQKITLADVDGTNLPPQPYEPENDATVAGIDKNNNGIRDDVELAIFAKYPNSAKIRAAELQYAMALQIMITQVFNTDTWKVAAYNYSRGDDCLSDPIRKKEVEALVLNIESRQTAEDTAFKFTTSLALPNANFCDIDLTSLPN